jgi:hypothetical protein
MAIKHMKIYTPVILPLRRLRQKDWEFEANLSYIARVCLQNNNTEKKF